MEDPDLMMHDVPPDQFITAGRAWLMTTKEGMDPNTFGYSPDAPERGWWCLRHDLIRDLASLNKFEAESSDIWGLMDKDESDVSPTDRELLDEAATLTASPDENFEPIQAFYSRQLDFRVPQSIKLYNYVNETMRTDDVSIELGLSGK